MKGKKKDDEKIDWVDWDALDRYWAEQYEEEFGHLF